MKITQQPILATQFSPLVIRFKPPDTRFFKINIIFPIKDGRVAYRGCSSDASDKIGNQYCAEHDEQCTRCQGSACNNNAATMILNPLSCVKCTSATDPNCVDLQTTSPATQCGQISSGYTDSCYVHVANGLVRRGCLSEQFSEIEADCKDSNTCELCSENTCNTKVIESETCYECDSEVDENCRTQLNATMAITCPLSVSKMGCYRYHDGGKWLIYHFFRNTKSN